MSNFIRLNLSAPTDFVEELKNYVPSGNMSKFLVEAGKEKIERLKREEAVKFFKDAGPLFPEIKDAAKYVHDVRRRDTEHRMKKIGL